MQPGLNMLLGYCGLMIQVGSIVLIAFALSYLEVRLHRRAVRVFSKTPVIWDKALVYALHRPVFVLIFVLGAFFSAYSIASHFSSQYFLNLFKVAKQIALISALTWVGLRFISQYEKLFEKYEKKTRIDRTTLHSLSQLLRASALIVAALMIMQTVGIGISGVLAFGGIAGAGIAFAAKDLLSNFFGGLMIFLDRPFSVGDMIASPDRKIEGAVEHIGWRLTRILTYEKRVLYLPNSGFLTMAVENRSCIKNRRIRTVVGVRYQDASKVSNIVRDVEAMLAQHEGIDHDQTYLARFIKFGASSLDLQIHALTKTIQWAEYLTVQQDIFLKTFDIIAKHDAQCAFPTTTLNLPEKIEVSSV